MRHEARGCELNVKRKVLGSVLALVLPVSAAADAFSPWSWGQSWPGGGMVPGLSPWGGLSGWPSAWNLSPGTGAPGWSNWHGIPLWGQQPWSGGVPVRSGTFTGLDRWVVTPRSFRYVRPPQAGSPHGWMYVEVDPSGDFHVQMEVRGNARAMMNAMSAIGYPGYGTGW